MKSKARKEEKQISNGVFLSQPQFHKKTAGSTVIGKSVMRRMGAITARFLQQQDSYQPYFSLWGTLSSPLLPCSFSISPKENAGTLFGIALIIDLFGETVQY